MNLFELKEKMAELNKAIAEDASWIAEKGADPTVTMDELTAKKAHRDELQTRFNMLKESHDAEEAKQKAHVMAQKNGEPKNDAEALIMAKGAFYRAALTGGDVTKTYEGLGAIPTSDSDLGYGEHLLPKTVSNTLLVEPVEVNPLRPIVRITNITGYEEPKLGFTIEDSDIADVTDKASANEIALTGDSVVYGRMKCKVNVTVKDTVLHGTNTDLVNQIENNIRSALAKREKYYAFLSASACTSDTTHAHMSFYKKTSGVSDITEVSGTNLYNAIKNAYADLPDDYAANAKIVMRKVDFYSIVDTLTNTAESLFGNKPASILGIPVVFCDKATTPVVGDFQYYGINYDIGSIYETDKDAKKGEYYFVFTAWGDQQIRMKSAFRLAVVDENPNGALLKSLKVGSLTLSPTFDKATTSYTATATTGATAKITAAMEDSHSTMVIKHGSTVVQNNGTVTWTAGSNTITVVVTDTNDSSITTTYTVTVTAS